MALIEAFDQLDEVLEERVRILLLQEASREEAVIGSEVGHDVPDALPQ